MRIIRLCEFCEIKMRFRWQQKLINLVNKETMRRIIDPNFFRTQLTYPIDNFPREFRDGVSRVINLIKVFLNVNLKE